MSVTFSPAHRDSDIAGWGLSCDCGDATTGVVADHYRAVEPLAATRAPSCGDDFCGAFPARPVPVMAVEPPEVNMSNSNARFVLEALGIIDEELVGGMEAEDFLARILMALAIAPDDEGVPAHDDHGNIVADPLASLVEAIHGAATGNPTTGARLVMCGRAPGYLQDRLHQLHEVALWARDNHRDVDWA